MLTIIQTERMNSSAESIRRYLGTYSDAFDFRRSRAFSISRESRLMDSLGDLYALTFKNLTSLYLPIALGILATAVFFR